jgi:hypothetical protein
LILGLPLRMKFMYAQVHKDMYKSQAAEWRKSDKRRVLLCHWCKIMDITSSIVTNQNSGNRERQNARRKFEDRCDRFAHKCDYDGFMCVYTHQHLSNCTH